MCKVPSVKLITNLSKLSATKQDLVKSRRRNPARHSLGFSNASTSCIAVMARSFLTSWRGFRQMIVFKTYARAVIILASSYQLVNCTNFLPQGLCLMAVWLGGRDGQPSCSMHSKRCFGPCGYGTGPLYPSSTSHLCLGLHSRAILYRSILSPVSHYVVWVGN